VLAGDVADQRIFSRIHSLVLPMFYAEYAQDDEELAAKCREFESINPEHLGVRKKFWSNGTCGNEPIFFFSASVKVLLKLENYHIPVDKLKGLTKLYTSICSCIDKFWPDAGKVHIGGDELLPLVTWVCLKANAPRLFSQLQYIQEFIRTETAIGERGYLLATFQSAVAYIRCLSKETLQQTSPGTRGHTSPRPAGDLLTSSPTVAPHSATSTPSRVPAVDSRNGSDVDTEEEAMPLQEHSILPSYIDHLSEADTVVDGFLVPARPTDAPAGEEQDDFFSWALKRLKE